MPYVKIRRWWEGSPPRVQSKTFFVAVDEAEAHAAAAAEPRGAEGWIEESPWTFAISKPTLTILKGLASLAGGELYLRAGRVQHVRGGNGRGSYSMLAGATLPEPWPKDTPLYNAKAFLRVLSSCTLPVIRFGDGSMTVSDNETSKGEYRTTLHYSDPSLLQQPVTKDFPRDNPAVEFDLSADDLRTLLKGTALLGLTHVTVDVQEQSIALVADADPKNPDSHQFRHVITNATRHDKTFTRSMQFRIEHLRLVLKGSYTMALSDWKYAVLTHHTLPVLYYVAADTPAEDVRSESATRDSDIGVLPAAKTDSITRFEQIKELLKDVAVEPGDNEEPDVTA